VAFEKRARGENQLYQSLMKNKEHPKVHTSVGKIDMSRIDKTDKKVLGTDVPEVIDYSKSVGKLSGIRLDMGHRGL